MYLNNKIKMAQNLNTKIVIMEDQISVKIRIKSLAMGDSISVDLTSGMVYYSNKKAFLKMRLNNPDQQTKIWKKLQICWTKSVKRKNQVTKLKLIKEKFCIKKWILQANPSKKIKEKKIKRCYQRNLHKTWMIIMKTNLRKSMKNYLNKKMKSIYLEIESRE